LLSKILDVGDWLLNWSPTPIRALSLLCVAMFMMPLALLALAIGALPWFLLGRALRLW
jgi:hypothetical protein